MGELMTKYVFYERHQEVIADTKKYVNEIANRYKNAYIYCIFKNLRMKLISSKEIPSLLMEQRKWENYNRPLITGSLYILKGNGSKKWQQVFCVLQPTYVLEVYLSEKAFESARKPNFILHHEIYEIIDNVDAHLSEVIKVYLREFGYIMENVSHISNKIGSPIEPTKRPSQHVLSLYHKYKGSIYLAFGSALERDKWLDYLRDAHRHLAGVHCENEYQKRAFEIAIKQACEAEEHCNINVRITGTQQQIVTGFITAYLSNGCKAMLQTKVKGDVIKKYKMWSEISKGLSDTVEEVVREQYPELRRKAEKDAEDLTQQIQSCLENCNTVYNSISENIQEDMAEKLNEELECRIQPKLPDINKKIEESVTATFEEVKCVFSSLADGLNEKMTSSSMEFANNIDTYFVKQMDRVPRDPEAMRSVFNTASLSLPSHAKEIFSKAPVAEYEGKLCLLAQTLLDSAVLMFEVLCGDAVSKNNGYLQKEAIAKVEAHVLKKFTHDCKVVGKKFLFDVVNSAICKTLYPSIHQCLKNKMQYYHELIPHDVAHILLLDRIFAETIAERVQEIFEDLDKTTFTTASTNGSVDKHTHNDDEDVNLLPSLHSEQGQSSGSTNPIAAIDNGESVAQVSTRCVQDMETGESTGDGKLP